MGVGKDANGDMHIVGPRSGTYDNPPAFATAEEAVEFFTEAPIPDEAVHAVREQLRSRLDEETGDTLLPPFPTEAARAAALELAARAFVRRGYPEEAEKLRSLRIGDFGTGQLTVRSLLGNDNELIGAAYTRAPIPGIEASNWLTTQGNITSLVETTSRVADRTRELQQEVAQLNTSRLGSRAEKQQSWSTGPFENLQHDIKKHWDEGWHLVQVIVTGSATERTYTMGGQVVVIGEDATGYMAIWER